MSAFISTISPESFTYIPVPADSLRSDWARLLLASANSSRRLNSPSALSSFGDKDLV